MDEIDRIVAGPDIHQWGAVMRAARRAASLAAEEMRQRKVIMDPLESSILLYTDDPTTAALFAHEADMAAICKASAIEGVVITMGDRFPPAAHEAPRDDMELPRVAAMWFPAPGEKCPRCRNYTQPADLETCRPCGLAVRARLMGEG